MATVILFNKPYGVLCQFTSAAGRPCLKDFVPVRGVYSAGRLDTDSEGLLVLTGDGALQGGLDLGDFVSRPCMARRIDEPAGLWPRDPPIRKRVHIPTAWLEMKLEEGKNRQVRRMTAKIGHPTLRLIRWAVGPWTLDGLAPGKWRDLKKQSKLSTMVPPVALLQLTPRSCLSTNYNF